MKHKKTLLINLAFAAVVLALAGLLLALRGQSSGAPLAADLIYGDGSTVLPIPLDQDARYDVDTGYLTVHIEVRDGAARFVDSPCPDHVCEGFGWIAAEDQTASCLPARAVLSIVPVP